MHEHLLTSYNTKFWIGAYGFQQILLFALRKIKQKYKQHPERVCVLGGGGLNQWSNHAVMNCLLQLVVWFQ